MPGFIATRWQWFKGLLDPQRRPGWDSVQHYLSGLLICGLAHLVGYSLGDSILIVLYVGIAYEAGQTDALYSSKSTLLGKEGFGFGILDLIADMAGALTFALATVLL